MSEPFVIRRVPAGPGEIGVAPLPGRTGDLAADLAKICSFGPALVISCTPVEEMAAFGVDTLPAALAEAGLAWRGFPVADFGTPSAMTEALWPDLRQEACLALKNGRRVLTHCQGGRGRSGMVALALLESLGVPNAFTLLRQIHPGAVETDAQREWAERTGRMSPPLS